MIFADLCRIKKIFDVIRKEENQYYHVHNCKQQNFCEIAKTLHPGFYCTATNLKKTKQMILRSLG